MWVCADPARVEGGPCGAEENNDPQQGKACRYLVAVKGILTEK